MSTSVPSPCLTLRLKTLTPIWLGDIDRNSGVAKPSGLIGSLRFWYEGILRSHGRYVCNPLGKGDHDREEDRCAEDSPCYACKLFGATGLARSFRLSIAGLEPTPVFFRASRGIAAVTGNWLWNIFGGEATGGRRYKGPDGRNRFEFGVKALWSDKPFEIRITPRGGADAKRSFSLVAHVVKTASELGGVGAKTQLGFGQVKLLSAHAEWPNLDAREMEQAASEYLRAGERRPVTGERFTLALERFFSHRYTLTGGPPPNLEDIGVPPPGFRESYIPCAFDIRYKYQSRNPRSGQGTDRGIRPTIEREFGKSFGRKTFGYSDGDDARGGRIHVSHIYREEAGTGPWRLRIWGDVDNKADVERVIEAHLEERFGPGNIRREVEQNA